MPFISISQRKEGTRTLLFSYHNLNIKQWLYCLSFYHKFTVIGIIMSFFQN
jgi:hypothetical protein